MPANSKFGCNFFLAKGAKQSFLFHLGFTPGNVSLQVVMNIIMPATIQRRAFALRRHIIGPEERFVAMLALNF
jgi:hypothetical protein